MGLLADIHEDVEKLSAAVNQLKARRVEAFVMLGDVLDLGERVDETVSILAPLPGAGVWGNHDFGLCGEVDASTRSRFSASALDYFARLRPSLDLEGIRFQHIDPHLDPETFEDLWRFPTAEERIAGFCRCPHSRVFMGHLHGWGIFTRDGRVPWEGDHAFQYRADERYLTVVNSVLDGWCAVLDTEHDELQPIRVS